MNPRTEKKYLHYFVGVQHEKAANEPFGLQVKQQPRQMRSQKCAKGGGLSRGSGGEARSSRKLGVLGQSPQPPEARESKSSAFSAKNFCIFFFFGKIT